jgi:hypothetical protein
MAMTRAELIAGTITLFAGLSARTPGGVDVTFAALLESTADDLAGNVTKYGPDPVTGATKCNFFARDLAQTVYGATIPELNADGLPPPDNSGQANALYAKLLISPNWTELTAVADDGSPDWAALFRDAVASAASTLVVAVYANNAGNGHIATIMPYPMDTKGYGNTMLVPYVAQAGPKIAQSPTGVSSRLTINWAFAQSRLATTKLFKRN